MSKRADTGKHEVRWRENGRNRSRSFTLKADADRFRAEVRRARENGRPLDLDRGKETLAEFIGVYWRRFAVPELAEKTREDYRGVWARHIKAPLGGYRLRDVTPAVVDELKANLRAADVGEPTIGKALTLLSGMFRQAVVWDRVDRNPLAEIKIPQPKRSRLVRPIVPEKVEAMRAILLGTEELRDALVIVVLGYAGVRPGELRALQWGDIGERTIRVERAVSGSRVKATKTEETRTVRLLAPLAADLAAWRDECNDASEGALVFPAQRGGLWTSTNWNNWCKRVYKTVAEAAGIAGSRPYDLRHSFASLLIHEGATVPELARQLGNAPSVTLDTYAHVFDDRDGARKRDPAEAIKAARAEFDVRGENAEGDGDAPPEGRNPASDQEALLRTRTADPLLTMEVLYQLS